MSTAAELIVKCLENEGVSVVFGIPGEENIRLVQALAASQTRYVLTRHEQAAAFMAEMYGRVTGRAAVVSATLGPGAINMQLGVADATTNSTPMVAISAQVGHDRQYKESHQYVDLVRMFAPITRPRSIWRCRNTSIQMLPTTISPRCRAMWYTPKPRRAVRWRGRSRFCALRNDRWCWPGTAQPAMTRPRHWSGSPTNSPSRSPTPSTGRESCPTITPTALGRWGSCGATMSTSGSTTPTSSSLSATNCRSSTRSRSIRKPTRRSSTYTVFRPRSAGHRFTSAATAPGRHLLAEEFARGQQDSRFPLAPQRVVGDTRAALGRSDAVLVDTGATKMWMARLYPTYERNTCLISNGLSTMAFALPGALGVKLARPESKVLAVVGDGALCSADELLPTLKTALDDDGVR